MELVIATSNSNKVREVDELLGGSGWNVRCIDSKIVLPPETGETFIENALIKADAVALKIKDTWILSDDSGLVVDVLNGEPGVKSARFAGEECDFNANNKKLMNLMNGIDNRKAAFVCAMVLISPDGEKMKVEGRCEGKIGFSLQGDGGFGYDPLFIPAGEDRSFAEMSADEKNAISHRGNALRKLKELLRGVP